jgi:ABC-type lipopolysaccharide export system ATPase subunit
MVDGKVLVQGTPEEVSSNELARKYFLGARFQY